MSEYTLPLKDIKVIAGCVPIMEFEGYTYEDVLCTGNTCSVINEESTIRIAMPPDTSFTNPQNLKAIITVEVVEE